MTTSKLVQVTKDTWAAITPACFDSKQQYILWRDKAIEEPPLGDNWICEDCTKKYQNRMVKEGRCCYPTRNLDDLKKTNGIFV